MEVHVDSKKCVAAGNCVLAAPSVFDQTDVDGTIVLLDPQPPEELRAAVVKAAKLCPASVITVDS
jgi:ferredoxin